MDFPGRSKPETRKSRPNKKAADRAEHDQLLSYMIAHEAQPLTGADDDYNTLIDAIGDAEVVLLGEATHGTHEFYRERSRITKRLIKDKGFTAIAVEADWPDAYRVNRYIRATHTQDTLAWDALGDFHRFPTWMWRNADMLNFVGWLREYNDELDENPRQQHPKVGFYGLDLYSLYTSMDAVIKYLDRVDPAAAERARYRYSCFDQFGEDAQSYGYAASFNLSRSCEDAVVQQLLELQHNANEYIQRDGRIPEDALFYAQQNARVAMNAEEYYRSMFLGRVESWNIRDMHMAQTLNELKEYIGGKQRQPAKIVVWAHNSHLGDARATEMGTIGELNIGQLVRQQYAGKTFSVGFTTHHGFVTAASSWDAPAERKHVRPALPGSYEDLFHSTGVPNFLLLLREQGKLADMLNTPRLERAIGVIYQPESERVSHYFAARMADQFDAVIHFDKTHAVEPLEKTPGWEKGEFPETYPSSY